jgi:hypothetical protein
MLLGREAFHRLCRANCGQYRMDLSEIRSDLNLPLLRSLEACGADSIVSLQVSCDRLAQFPPGGAVPDSVSNSIAVAVPNYFRDYSAVIARMAWRSSILKEIHLISVDAVIDDLVLIARAARQSAHLCVFDLVDIAIGDSNIELIISELLSPTITSVTFRHCGLTDRCIPAFVRYAETVRRRFGRSGLIVIDLSDNGIDPRNFRQLTAALNAMDIAETALAEAKEMEALEAENENLRREVERMRKIAQEVKERNALFIIGDGAPELVKQLQTIDRRITSLEH